MIIPYKWFAEMLKEERLILPVGRGNPVRYTLGLESVVLIWDGEDEDSGQEFELEVTEDSVIELSDDRMVLSVTKGEVYDEFYLLDKVPWEGALQ